MNARTRSFTLLEMLCVAALLGLMAALGTRSLLTSTGSPTQTLRRMAAIDAEARLVARRSGPCSITLERDESRSKTAVLLVAGEKSRSYDFDRLIGIEEGLAEIAFDRHGQSVDYTVTVEGTDRTLRIAGLTGWSSLDGE